MDSLVESNTTFALALYNKLNEENADQNIFFSPWSITSALSMIWLGTMGNTKSQMAQVLKFNETKSTKGCKTKNPGAVKGDIHSAFQKLVLSINEPTSKYDLKTANRLYSEKTFSLVKEYTEQVQKYYHAEIEGVDFMEAAEDVRKKINDWVQEQTQGKIKDLLPHGQVDSLTRLVLVNAIYFKGNWETKFPEENTELKPFRMTKTKSKPVQMMYQKNKFNLFYIDELETNVLELPYINKELSMIILLPDEIKDDTTGLEQLENTLSYRKLREWTSSDKMMKAEVEVELPRIHLEESYDLKTTLKNMGISDLFTAGRADLSGISGDRDLYLSQVFHKSFVEINEEGTEAAAATAGVIAVRNALLSVKVEADHPFLFFIRHNNTKTILFFGKFCSP